MVLQIIKDGTSKPTRIMYAANLSWKPTRRILGSLVEQGLLVERVSEGSKRSRLRYGVSERGLSVLRYFEGARDLIDIDDVITTT